MVTREKALGIRQETINMPMATNELRLELDSSKRYYSPITIGSNSRSFQGVVESFRDFRGLFTVKLDSCDREFLVAAVG